MKMFFYIHMLVKMGKFLIFQQQLLKNIDFGLAIWLVYAKLLYTYIILVFNF